MAQSKSKALKDYLLIALGALVYSVSFSIFLQPNSLVTGGATGISAIIHYATGIQISYPYAILNTILLILGIKILGGRFGAKTIFAVAMLTIFLRIIPEVLPGDFVNEISVSNGKLLSAIIGGGINALGTSLMIAHGGSSGGTDIIALIVNKIKGTPTALVILIVDVAIIASSLIIPTDEGWGARVATVIYGYINIGVYSYVLDRIINTNKQCVQLFVFSRNFAKIADRINTETGRGVSIIKAEGWYSKSEVEMMMIVAQRSQLAEIMRIVKEEDPASFYTVGNVMGVYGEGFQKIKK